eukprot:COSAG02_NODE_717_length_18070_cov_20.762700_3_plen_68_part_00
MRLTGPGSVDAAATELEKEVEAFHLSGMVGLRIEDDPIAHKRHPYAWCDLDSCRVRSPASYSDGLGE